MQKTTDLKRTEKTRHTFPYLGREWTLMRRGRRWTLRLTVGGKLVWLAMKTPDVTLAVRRAKTQIDERASGRLEKELEARPQGKVPTFGEVAKVYREARLVREQTTQDNINTLFRLVRAAVGIKEVASLRIDVLSAETAHAWLAKKQGLERPDYGTMRAGNVSANATLRQARSVFARRHRSIWNGWALPTGVDGFCAVKLLPQGSQRYVPLPSQSLVDMDAAAVDLEKTDLEMWIVNRSIRLMGLRAGEVMAMKTSWLTEFDGRLSLDVRARPGEFVPKGHEGSVTVPAVLAGIFRQRLKEAGEKPAHLVRVTRQRKGRKETEDETARYDLIYRRHSQWLRKFLPAGRKKTNHELRKEAGSRVAKKLNSWEAAARFLREDLETAKRHYLELLEPVGLEEGDLG